VRLTTSERIDVISNLTAELRAGTLHGERYLRLIRALANDPAPEVVRGAVEALNETHIALATPRSVPFVGSFIRATFEPTFRRYGLRPAPNEPPSVSFMRPALMHLLAAGGRDAPRPPVAAPLAAAAAPLRPRSPDLLDSRSLCRFAACPELPFGRCDRLLGAPFLRLHPRPRPEAPLADAARTRLQGCLAGPSLVACPPLAQAS